MHTRASTGLSTTSDAAATSGYTFRCSTIHGAVVRAATTSENANGARGSACAASKVVRGSAEFAGVCAFSELLLLPTDVIVMKDC